MNSTSETMVRIWDSVNEYAEACGGDTSEKTVSNRRMDAVVGVTVSVDGLVRQLREALEVAFDALGSNSTGLVMAAKRRVADALSEVK